MIAYGLQEKQDQIWISKTGPSKKAAYNEDGLPAKALLGFVGSNQATVDQVIWQDLGKGEVAVVKKHYPGLATEELLPAWIEVFIKSIPFPKKMRWGSGGLEFARPVRWVVCLWGNDVLPVEINEIKSGRISMGNRFTDLESCIEIATPQDYFPALKQINVIAERQERYETINKQLETILPPVEFQVDLDEALLQTVTDLVEWPTAVVAEFEEKFLVLPDKIITSTISTNQKYFAVMSKTGKLTNKFVFVSNGNPEWNELISKGNEKVVKPRLEDAMWYFHEDTKQPLDTYLPMLKDVVFQAKLGTLKEKTDRIIEISQHLGKVLELSDKEITDIARTALLCKADLVTKMLGEKEFTKLQGYIGMHYALASGEPEQVATGIYEHYMPRGQNDELPKSLCGSIVAVADKLDTVCGIIGIGMLPTGSADPFALRRAANGIVQVIAANKWDVDIADLIKFTLGRFVQQEINSSGNTVIVLNYFHQRINWYLQQLKIDYDVIDSVMHIDFGNLLHLVQRAKALQEFKTNTDFVKLVIGFKRVSNIIKDEANKLRLDKKLLAEPAEQALFSSLQKLESNIESDLDKLNYTGVLNHLVGIRADIDKFFDDVLVNTDAANLRINRYALLQEIRCAFLQVADLSLLVVEGV